jgi:hypothetical protein
MTLVPGAAGGQRQDGPPGGPLPLTLRQAGLAAAAVVAVALVVSLALPVAAALGARRIVPPGAVVVGEASLLPADGWVVADRSAEGDAVLLARAGTQLLVRYETGSGDPLAALADLTRATAQEAPELGAVGGVRTFTTVTDDRGYLQAIASPGTTGALAVVAGERARVLVQAAGPATSFSPLSGQVGEMVTGIRLREGDS